MASVTIYHNPRCSKSRQTLALLRERGVEPTVVEYLKHPPDSALLRDLLKKLGLMPRDLVRTKEAAYKDLKLADASDEKLIEAMVANPLLIERPIVVTGNKAAIGRPPERALDLLS